MDKPFVIRLMRFLGQTYSLVSYPLYYRQRLSTTTTARLFGFDLTIPPSVFHPQFFFSTKIFCRYVQSLPLNAKRVLEMGVGSGLVSLVAAAAGATVVGVDCNPEAVRATRSNAEENGCAEKITTLQSDLFSNVNSNERFDYILWNPPFFEGEPTSDSERAWKAGADYRVIAEFAHHAHSFLAVSGRVIIILSSHCPHNKILRFFEASGFHTTRIIQHQSFFERFFIYEIMPSNPVDASALRRPSHV